MTEIEEIKKLVVEVLCGQALADHLGDVRDKEAKLWQILGIDQPIVDYHSAWGNTKATLMAHNIPLPSYLKEEENDD